MAGGFTGAESYILVQIDDEGNTVLVPTSSFNDPLTIPSQTTIHHQVKKEQVEKTKIKSESMGIEEEKPKPFRYILPDLDNDEKMDNYDEEEQNSCQFNSYYNIVQSTNHHHQALYQHIRNKEGMQQQEQKTASTTSVAVTVESR